MTGSKKMLIIYILEILKKYTDADHKLFQEGIINKIRAEYGMECERKAIGRSITELAAFGFDIDYDNGYYLREHEFEDSELRLLVDSVLGSHYIPAQQAKELIDKLNGLSNIYFKKKMRHVTNVSKLLHTDNTQLFYTIDVLDLSLIHI